MIIKRVGRSDEESGIAQMLSTAELRADPRNHCVPIIEIFDDPDDDSISYMVMPLLRNASNPPFQYVKEIIDFVDQILEAGCRLISRIMVFDFNSQGLVFMHEKGVAHRYELNLRLNRGTLTH